jgi:repressor LexA
MPKQVTETLPLYALAVKKRRAWLGLTGDQLADHTYDVKQGENAISQRTVSAIETGRQEPINLSAYRFGWLLDALEWTPNQFSEATGLEVPASLLREVYPPEATPLGEIVPIRYLGDVAGGLFASGQNIDDPKLIEVPRFFIGSYNPADLFGLSVSGHSMASPDAKQSIPEGSLVLVHSKLERHSGRVVVCYLLDEGIGVIKTWQEADGGTWLTSYNPDQTTYAPIPINKSTRARFCGVVIGSYNPMVTPNGRPLF